MDSSGTSASDTTTTRGHARRCPACHSRTVVGQRWCSLCHAALLPAPGRHAAVREPDRPAADGEVPAQGAQGDVEPVSAEQLLAELAVSEHARRLPARLSVLDRLDSPALRLGAGAVGVVLVMLAGLAVMGVVGSLL